MGRRSDIRRRIKRLERETEPGVSHAAVAEALTRKLTEFIRDPERVQRVLEDPESALNPLLWQFVEWCRRRQEDGQAAVPTD